jgi:hypothetical protein
MDPFYYLDAYHVTETAERLRHFFLTLPMKSVMQDTRWAWPTAESIHFLGLTLLVGTVGSFDLRLLGVAPGIAPAALHRLIKYGVMGFIGNILTGLCFLSAAPDQYIYNPAFRWKWVFLTCAGINILVFYTRYFRKVSMLGPNEPIPLGARIVGAVSLSVWVGVISAGRLITFYRPPQLF